MFKYKYRKESENISRILCAAVPKQQQFIIYWWGSALTFKAYVEINKICILIETNHASP